MSEMHRVVRKTLAPGTGLKPTYSSSCRLLPFYFGVVGDGSTSALRVVGCDGFALPSNSLGPTHGLSAVCQVNVPHKVNSED